MGFMVYRMGLGWLVGDLRELLCPFLAFMLGGIPQPVLT